MKTEAPRRVGANKETLARNAGMALSGVETGVTTHLRTKAELEQARGLMDAVCERGNLQRAYQRVMENKGASGVDGIGVPEFRNHLKQHWPTIKAKLLGGGATFPRQYAGWTYRNHKVDGGHSAFRR